LPSPCDQKPLKEIPLTGILIPMVLHSATKSSNSKSYQLSFSTLKFWYFSKACSCASLLNSSIPYRFIDILFITTQVLGLVEIPPSKILRSFAFRRLCIWRCHYDTRQACNSPTDFRER